MCLTQGEIPTPAAATAKTGAILLSAGHNSN